MISIKKIIPVWLEIKELIAALFIILVKRARKCQKPFTVFKTSLEDITKALHPKVIRTPAELRKLLPAQYHNHLPLFERDVAAELLPHRPIINYIFILQRGKNG